MSQSDTDKAQAAEERRRNGALAGENLRGYHGKECGSMADKFTETSTPSMSGIKMYTEVNKRR